MKKKIRNYFGNKLMDFAEWVMAQKPPGVSYTAEDKETMRRIRKCRAEFK